MKSYEKMTNVERVAFHRHDPDGVVAKREALMDALVKMNMKDSDQSSRLMSAITESYDDKLTELYMFRERVRPDELQSAIDQVKRSSARLRRLIKKNESHDKMWRRLYDNKD